MNGEEILEMFKELTGESLDDDAGLRLMTMAKDKVEADRPWQMLRVLNSENQSVVGRTYEDFSTGKGNRRVFLYSKKLYDKFIEEYGSPICKDIHKKLFGRAYKLLDPTEYKEFEAAGAHVDKCPAVSGNAAKWAAEIILDIRKK